MKTVKQFVEEEINLSGSNQEEMIERLKQIVLKLAEEIDILRMFKKDE